MTLILAATILAITKVFTSDQWIEYTKWIFGFYATSEGISAAAEHFKNGKIESARVTAAATCTPAPPAPADGNGGAA